VYHETLSRSEVTVGLADYFHRRLAPSCAIDQFYDNTLILAVPDINEVVLSPVSVNIQIREGDALRKSEVKNNPVSNNKPDVEEIGNHQEVVRALYIRMLARNTVCRESRMGGGRVTGRTK